MSQTEESQRIPAQQVASERPFRGGEVVTNPDSSRSGPRGSKILIVLVASLALAVVAFIFVYMSRL
ncbi:hypothetical protein PY365_22800 [Roseiarcaceae bacterium H3SJ34-1]|uniref:hypothetical protein n=1 Tax=Terripilifer ovatus TaxID=3032367 RepID=UPI003AB944C2|nr:hypothetical protein [Roseiarcaceae bacterium H3SJ34-1]